MLERKKKKYHNDGYMSLCVCLNPQNGQHRERTILLPINHNGLWVIMRCQCGFISCNKCPHSGGDVDSEGGGYVRGQRIYGKSLYHPFNFAVNLKLL